MDDSYVLVGSANINQRSLGGNRDAILLRIDVEFCPLTLPFQSDPQGHGDRRWRLPAGPHGQRGGRPPGRRAHLQDGVVGGTPGRGGTGLRQPRRGPLP